MFDTLKRTIESQITLDSNLDIRSAVTEGFLEILS